MDPLQFRLTTAQVADEAYVVTLAGEFDLYNAGEIDRELDRLVGEGARFIVVDLLEVPFIESTVLGVLVKHVRRLRPEGGELVIVSDDVRIARVFEVSGLRSYFRFERTLAAALEIAVAEAVP